MLKKKIMPMGSDVNLVKAWIFIAFNGEKGKNAILVH